MRPHWQLTLTVYATRHKRARTEVVTCDRRGVTSHQELRKIQIQIQNGLCCAE